MSARSRRSRALTRTRSILSLAIAVLPHAVPVPRLVEAAGRLPPHRSCRERWCVLSRRLPLGEPSTSVDSFGAKGEGRKQWVESSEEVSGWVLQNRCWRGFAHGLSVG
jgi:hypothetical protein